MLENKTITSEMVYQGRIINVRRDQVRLSNGNTAAMEVVESVDATAIVALTADRKVLLIEQYRHAVGGMLLEIPAGKMEPGESPEDCARRELEEETGYRPGAMRWLASFYASPGFCTEKIHLYLAEGLMPAQQKLDQDECIEVAVVPLDEALAQVERGEIRDAKTMVGLLTAYQVLSNCS